MSQLWTTFDPTSATSGNFVVAFKTGCGTLHIKNASPVDVGFALDSSSYVQYVVQAGEPRDIPVLRNRSTVYWSQQQKLKTNSKMIQSVVYVEQYEKGEVIPTSQALARHVNSVNIGYIFNITLTGDGTHWVEALVFNPANSGVNAIFYAATISSAATGFFIVLGADTSDPTIGTQFPNAGYNQLLGAGGFSSASAFETSTTRTNPSGTTIRQETLSTSPNPFDFHQYPDQLEAVPGTGLHLAALPTVASTNVNFTFKFTETPV